MNHHWLLYNIIAITVSPMIHCQSLMFMNLIKFVAAVSFVHCQFHFTSSGDDNSVVTSESTVNQIIVL